MAHAVNWFEIPVSDLDRAVKFYEEVLGADLQRQTMNNTEMAFLPWQQGEVSGALCKGEFYKPSDNGVVLYLNGGEDLSKPLSKVEGAGGKVLMEKTKINDDIGYMAFFLDSEGNRVAFHSPK